MCQDKASARIVVSIVRLGAWVGLPLLHMPSKTGFLHLQKHLRPGQEHSPCISLSLLHLEICLLHRPCTPVAHLHHICMNGIGTNSGSEISAAEIRRKQIYSAA